MISSRHLFHHLSSRVDETMPLTIKVTCMTHCTPLIPSTKITAEAKTLIQKKEMRMFSQLQMQSYQVNATQEASSSITGTLGSSRSVLSRLLLLPRKQLDCWYVMDCNGTSMRICTRVLCIFNKYYVYDIYTHTHPVYFTRKCCVYIHRRSQKN